MNSCVNERGQGDNLLSYKTNCISFSYVCPVIYNE